MYHNSGGGTYWISEHSDAGYVGILTDTVYEDGSDYTDWCQFVGTQEECEAYIKAKEDSYDRSNQRKDIVPRTEKGDAD